MGRDPPPQTVREAIGLGWTAMSFECRRCRRTGRIDLAPFDSGGWRGLPLAHVFYRVRCGGCGARPTYARLAAQYGENSWHEKRIEVAGDEIRRAARE